MTDGPVFFDLDDTLLDDTGAEQRDKLTRTGIVDRFAVIVTSDATRLSKLIYGGRAALAARDDGFARGWSTSMA